MLERHRSKHVKKIEIISALIGRGDDNPDSFDFEARDSAAGGVLLENDEPPGEEDDEEAFNRAFPSLIQTKSPPSEADTDLIEMVKKTAIEQQSDLNEWPALGETKPEESRSAWGIGSIQTATRMFPLSRVSGGKSTTELKDIVIGHKDTALRLSDKDGDVLDTHSHKYNPETFRNVMDRYKCPYPACG